VDSVFHITHVENLASIVRDGCLWSDAEMIAQQNQSTNVGMSGIKHARLSMPVKCHPGDMVGEYVPFYFCPRSVMLFILHRGNHPNLEYRDGQQPIVHLEIDLDLLIRWCNGSATRWAIALSNARAIYTQFRATRQGLDEVNWDAVAARDFRDPQIKEAKQAEFLVRRQVPWGLVKRIGTISDDVGRQVHRELVGALHRPRVETIGCWYF
jgi:hypothetical protein